MAAPALAIPGGPRTPTGSKPTRAPAPARRATPGAMTSRPPAAASSRRERSGGDALGIRGWFHGDPVTVPPRVAGGQPVGIVAPAGPVKLERLRLGLACLGDAFELRV